MSPTPSHRATASLLVVCCTASIACSGSNNESLKDLTRGRRDASADSATSAEPEHAEDAATSTSHEDASVPDEVASDASDEAGESESREAGAMDAPPTDADPSDAGAPAADADAEAPSHDAGDAADAAGEGGDADAAPDSDAAAPRIRLTLTQGGVPVPGAYLVYHGVEDQVIGLADTDAQGVARSELDVLALTVVLPARSDATTLSLFTYFGVQTGDDLKLELPITDEIETSYALSLSAYPGALRYEAGGGPGACLRGATDGAESNLRVTNPAGCLAATGNAVLVSAFSLVRDVPLLSAYALASGLPAPAAGTTAAVQVGAFQPYQDVHLRGLNPLADLPISVGLRALLGDQQLPLVAKGARPELSQSAPDLEFAAPTFSFAAFLARAEYSAEGMQHQLQRRTADASTASDLTLDFANALPPIRDFMMDAEARARPYVYWTSDAAPGRDAYLFEVRLRGRDAGESPAVVWAALTPPSAPRARLPPLPAELLVAIPSTAAFTWETERITAIGSSRLLDYAALRQHKLVYLSGAAHLSELQLDAAGHTELASSGLLP